MKSRLQHKLVALVLLLLMLAMLAPLILREPTRPGVVLDLTIPPLPALDTPDASPPVSLDEQRRVDAAIDAARADVRLQAESVGEPVLSADSLPVPVAWAVLVTVFPAEAEARAMQHALLEAEYRSYVQAVAGSGWQVLVGPELERNRAEASRERLRHDSRFALDTQVVPFKP
ncbi:MAG: SPOR domain-containing protein [Alcanivoracaceae bacterium]